MVDKSVRAVALAWGKTVDLITKIFETSETRKLKSAALQSQLFMKRASRISGKVKADKQCNKYRKKFDRLII